MESDDVLKEVRRIREEYAAQFKFDIDAIHADILKRQNESGRTYISFPPRRPKAVKTPSAEDPSSDF